jgi:hypothetical protein
MMAATLIILLAGSAAAAAEYPDLEADLRWLGTVAETYDRAHRDMLGQTIDFDRIERIRQAQAGYEGTAERFNKMVQATYKAFLDKDDSESKTKQAVRFRKAMKPAWKAVVEFHDWRKRHLQYARKRFDEAMRGVEGTLRDARRHGEVGRFEPDGRPKSLVRARYILDMTAALDPDDPSPVEEMTVEYEVMLDESRAVYGGLRDEVLAKTRTPDDHYRRADRDELAESIEAAWQQRWPDDNIVGLRFHAGDWKRNERWQWNSAQSSWLKNDVSVLPVTVVVENPEDDTGLLMYYAYANKDHTKGDAITIGVETKGEGYVVREMLRANYRP